MSDDLLGGARQRLDVHARRGVAARLLDGARQSEEGGNESELAGAAGLLHPERVRKVEEHDDEVVLLERALLARGRVRGRSRVKAKIRYSARDRGRS